MGKVLPFKRLKIGEVVTIEVKEKAFRCEVLAHEGNNIYKLRILEGENRGKFLHFEMVGYEDQSHE